jgi:o-succinylbenzoate synthase
MKIRGLDFKKYRRRLRTPLATTHGFITEREGFLVRVHVGGGLAGFGEAAPLPGYSPDDMDLTEQFLDQVAAGLTGCPLPDSPANIETLVSSIIPSSNPSSRFALETAFCDLASRAAGLPLARWLNKDAIGSVEVNYLAETNPDWQKIARDVESRGYGTLKIKLSGDASADVERLRQARRRLGTDIKIRVDANRAWDFKTARQVIDLLGQFDIEYIEEPLRNFGIENYQRLRGQTGAAIALDESLANVPDPGEVAAAGCCDVLVLKPALLGGLFKTLQLVSLAAEAGTDIVVTTTLETEVGTAAALHLAAALAPRRACGLDTLRLFDGGQQDLAVSDGGIDLPDEPGLGAGLSQWSHL